MNEKGIDLGALFFKLRLKWYYFVITIPIALGIAYYINLTSDRVYKFKSSVQVSPKKTGSKNTDQLMNVFDRSDNRKIEDEIGILTSYDLVKKAIEKLNFGVGYYHKTSFKTIPLYADSPIEVILDSNQAQIINTPIAIRQISKTEYELIIKEKSVQLYDLKKNKILEKSFPEVNIKKRFKFGKLYSNEFFGLKINLVRDFMQGNYFFTVNDLESVSKTFHKKLTVKPIARESFLLELNTSGTVPDKEVKFLNKLMEVYVEKDLQEKNLTGKLTLEFLEKQIRETDKNLINAESAIENYKSSNVLMNVTDLSKQAIENINSLEKDKIKLELQLANYKYIYQQILQSENKDDFIVPSTTNIEDNTINNLINQLAGKHRDKAALSQYAKDENPKMKEIKEEIRNLQSFIKEYLVNNINSTVNSLAATNNKIAETQTKISQMPTDYRKLDDMERDFTFNKDNYELLFSKRAEAQIALASNTPDIKIVDVAKMDGNGPISPSSRLNYLIAFFLAVTIPILVILLQEFMNERVLTKEDLQSITNIPIIGLIAKSEKKVNIVLLEHPNSLIAESFRLLKIKLSSYGKNSPNKVIGITSTIDGEGKSFCAVNLSVAFSLSHQKTLLLCADLHKPKIQEYFQLEEAGLSSYLNDEVGISDIIQKTKIPSLDVIAAGPVPLNPAEMLGNPLMTELLDYLRTSYQYIIIDTPPLGYVSDYLFVHHLTDLTLYMVRYNYSKRKLLSEINEMYENQVIKNLNIVFNNINYSSVYELRFKEGKYVHENEMS